MKLGVLLDRSDPQRGGAEAHTFALLARCLAAGDAAAVATLEGSAPPGVALLRIAAPRRRPLRDRVFAERGVAALRDAGCDCVLALRHAEDCDVYFPHGGLVADARVARGEARARRRTFSFWGLDAGERRFRFFLAAERQLLGAVDGPLVLCVSEGLRQRIRGAFPPSARRLVVVRNGVDAERFDPSRFVGERAVERDRRGLNDALVGLFLAHDPWLKGLATAIDALADERVRTLERPFHLLVGGRRLPRVFARRARRLGVADRLHVLGPLADPRPLMAAADMLIHPTWHDPMSLVCLEALAMGLPVVTTPRNGIREVMGQRGGIVVEAPGSAEAIAVAIRVLDDDALRAFTADDARHLALRHRAGTALDAVLDHCRNAAAARADRPRAT